MKTRIMIGHGYGHDCLSGGQEETEDAGVRERHSEREGTGNIHNLHKEQWWARESRGRPLSNIYTQTYMYVTVHVYTYIIYTYIYICLHIYSGGQEKTEENTFIGLFCKRDL